MFTFLFSAIFTFLALVIIGCVAFYAFQLIIMILGSYAHGVYLNDLLTTCVAYKNIAINTGNIIVCPSLCRSLVYSR